MNKLVTVERKMMFEVKISTISGNELGQGLVNGTEELLSLVEELANSMTAESDEMVVRIKKDGGEGLELDFAQSPADLQDAYYQSEAALAMFSGKSVEKRKKFYINNGK